MKSNIFGTFICNGIKKYFCINVYLFAALFVELQFQNKLSREYIFFNLIQAYSTCFVLLVLNAMIFNIIK